MIEQTDRILAHLTGYTFESYEQDSRTSDAVERCLARISEACAKLGAILILCIRTHRGVRSWIRQRSRHRYEEIIHTLVWNTVKHDLPNLRASAMAELKRLEKAG